MHPGGGESHMRFSAQRVGAGVQAVRAVWKARAGVRRCEGSVDRRGVMGERIRLPRRDPRGDPVSEQRSVRAK